jgi:hypothetical protein
MIYRGFGFLRKSRPNCWNLCGQHHLSKTKNPIFSENRILVRENPIFSENRIF